jgi:hypothetical protein
MGTERNVKLARKAIRDRHLDGPGARAFFTLSDRQMRRAQRLLGKGPEYTFTPKFPMVTTKDGKQVYLNHKARRRLAARHVALLKKGVK